MKPIFLVYMGLKVLLLPNDISVIKKNNGQSNKKRCLISDDYSIEDFKI